MKLGDLAQRLDCELVGDPDVEIEGVAPLEKAGPGQLTFLANRRLDGLARASRAGAMIVPLDFEALGIPVLRSDNPYLSFARALGCFHSTWQPELGIHASAVVAESAQLGRGVRLGPNVVIGERARLGDEVAIDANATIYPDVEIGAGTRIYANCVVREGCRLGERVVLQPGAVIGGDGFGFAPDAEGRYHKIPQVGIVVLADDVEIGANTCVDRATMGATYVGAGTKLDNLVQIGHGCSIGAHTVIAALAGLAGSTTVGEHVMIGGQVGTRGHHGIGDRAIVAARSGVVNTIEPGRTVSGFPALDTALWKRAALLFGKLPEFAERLRRLERHAGVRDRNPD